MNGHGDSCGCKEHAWVVSNKHLEDSCRGSDQPHTAAKMAVIDRGSGALIKDCLRRGRLVAPNGGLKLGITGAIQVCIRLYEDEERTAVGGQALSIALACCFTCTEVKVEHCRGDLAHHNIWT